MFGNSRRQFLQKSLSYTAGVGFGVNLFNLEISKAAPPVLNMQFAELLKAYPADKVDQEINYLQAWSEKNTYYPQAKKFLNDRVFGLHLPMGKKLILGSYKHVSLDMFCAQYGPLNCLGVDIFNYKNHPQSLVKDVRDLRALELGSLSLGWNNVSVWSGSPRSKLAGFEFLKESLVRGGFLIENPTQYIPKDIDFKDFKLVYQDNFGSIWQKIS